MLQKGPGEWVIYLQISEMWSLPSYADRSTLVGAKMRSIVELNREGETKYHLKIYVSLLLLKLQGEIEQYKSSQTRK